MKKRASLLLCLLFLLSSCSRGPDAGELESRLRSDFASAPSIKLTASVRADYGERVYDFDLCYERTDGGATVTILSPESVAGISARVGEDGLTLEYEGAEVYTGALTDDGLSPAAALPLAVDAWGGGLLLSARIESGLLVCEHFISESVTLVSSFDSESLVPVSSELISGGYRTLLMEFGDVVM
ncbi:MAG: hypothetical protein II583_03130 [Oscillospiraceae bacterium]|nr:hypothetical protein [Oscillospiraceae bacterium]